MNTLSLHQKLRAAVMETQAYMINCKRMCGSDREVEENKIEREEIDV